MSMDTDEFGPMEDWRYGAISRSRSSRSNRPIVFREEYAHAFLVSTFLPSVRHNAGLPTRVYATICARLQQARERLPGVQTTIADERGKEIDPDYYRQIIEGAQSGSVESLL